jgi:hypothetical protein
MANIEERQFERGFFTVSGPSVFCSVQCSESASLRFALTLQAGYQSSAISLCLLVGLAGNSDYPPVSPTIDRVFAFSTPEKKPATNKF